MKRFKIPVAFTNYKVVPHKAMPACDGEEVQGYCDFDKKEIHVHIGSSEDLTRAALWHEFFHAVFDTIGRVELVHDEALVESLAQAVMRVRLEHPEI